MSGSIAPTLVRGAIVYRGGAAIDGDGSPNCYSPNGDGLDYLANAGHDGDWFGVVTDNGKPTGNPVIGANGKYLSPTSLVDRSKSIMDPARYVDSEQVEYCTLTKAMRALGAQFGDLGMAVYKSVLVELIAADYGPHPGEISIKAARAAGIPASPKNGGVGDGVTLLVFCGTASQPAWPRDPAEWKPAARAAFDAWGGAAAVAAL